MEPRWNPGISGAIVSISTPCRPNKLTTNACLTCYVCTCRERDQFFSYSSSLARSSTRVTHKPANSLTPGMPAASQPCGRTGRLSSMPSIYRVSPKDPSINPRAGTILPNPVALGQPLQTRMNRHHTGARRSGRMEQTSASPNKKPPGALIRPFTHRSIYPSNEFVERHPALIYGLAPSK